MSVSTPHLDEERLLALGLDPALDPSPDERAHLDACSRCSDELAAERALSLELAALPVVEPPPGLDLVTQHRFARAFEARHARRQVAALVAACVALALLSVPLLLALVGNLGAIAHGLAEGVQALVVTGVAAGAVVSKIPLFPVAVLGAGSIAALLAATTLTRLAWRTAEVHA